MKRALRAAAGAEAVEFVDGHAARDRARWATRSPPTCSCWATRSRRDSCRCRCAPIERAIELNGAAVESSKAAFAWGRLAAHDRAAVERAAGRSCCSRRSPRRARAGDASAKRTPIADRLPGRGLRRPLSRVRSRGRGGRATVRRAGRGLTEAVARSLYKLMAYKDEYEVARLYTDGAFPQKLARAVRRRLQLAFHLAPPLFARRDPATGEPRKREYGAGCCAVFRVLARMKRLRGTRARSVRPHAASGAPSGRRSPSSSARSTRLAADLDAANYALAVEIAALPQTVRGFGHVKERNRAEYEKKQAALLARFGRAAPMAQAAD